MLSKVPSRCSDRKKVSGAAAQQPQKKLPVRDRSCPGRKTPPRSVILAGSVVMSVLVAAPPRCVLLVIGSPFFDRFRTVFHPFIDGFSPFLPFLQTAHENQRHSARFGEHANSTGHESARRFSQTIPGQRSVQHRERPSARPTGTLHARLPPRARASAQNSQTTVCPTAATLSALPRHGPLGDCVEEHRQSTGARRRAEFLSDLEAEQGLISFRHLALKAIAAGEQTGREQNGADGRTRHIKQALRGSTSTPQPAKIEEMTIRCSSN